MKCYTNKSHSSIAQMNTEVVQIKSLCTQAAGTLFHKLSFYVLLKAAIPCPLCLFLTAMPSGCSIHLLLFTSFSYLYRLCLILTNASNTCSNKIFCFCDRCSRHLYALLPNIRPGGHNWPGKDSNLDRWKALDNMNQCIAELSQVL